MIKRQLFGKKNVYMVSVYSVSHFIVDFACAFLMFRGVSQSDDWYLCLLLYNFCAFAMQMPLGVLADKLNKNFLFAAIGCALVGSAYALLFFPAAAAITAGIGNGMFHIGGGIDVLNISGKKSGALGVFVSPGALGIYFGTILGKASGLPVIPVLLALLLAAVFILSVPGVQGSEYLNNSEFSLSCAASKRVPGLKTKTSSKNYFNFFGFKQPQAERNLNLFSFISITAVLCLFLVVCLRSYVGFTLSFPWKTSSYWGMALACAVVLGKTAGGFAADKFGTVKASCASLTLAALLFLFPHIPIAGVLSILLFNMTMPVTLWAVAKIFPGAKGFSFGLLTFALFIGFLPVHSGAGTLMSVPWMFALAALVSLAFLWFSLRLAKL